jgi:putative restriction endonuclease
MSGQPSQYGQPWTHDELILAFDLYCRIPFKATKASNAAVVELARILSRSPAGVARKLGNFGAFDPELHKRNIVGLAHGSRRDREVWDEFHNDWTRLVEKAERLRARLRRTVETHPPFSGRRAPQGPSERVVSAKQRLHQTFFRQTVLSSYENRCCVTGLTIPEALVASHIVPWSHDERRRVDPTNGLCLSATFDRLFDCGLICIEPDLTLRCSKQLMHRSDSPVCQLILPYHQRPIGRPVRFLPSTACLQWHRCNVFRD